MAAAMHGLSDRLAFRDGQPTPLYARLMQTKQGCRHPDDLKRRILQLCCCPYCGGEITPHETCPGCGAPKESA